MYMHAHIRTRTHIHAHIQSPQYESIEVAKPVNVKPATNPPPELYSEVFDALPKGKSTVIVVGTTTVPH